MLRHSHIRFLLVVMVCVTMTVAPVQAQTFGMGKDWGPSAGEVVAILVGAGVIIGLAVKDYGVCTPASP